MRINFQAVGFFLKISDLFMMIETPGPLVSLPLVQNPKLRKSCSKLYSKKGMQVNGNQKRTTWVLTGRFKWEFKEALMIQIIFL